MAVLETSLTPAEYLAQEHLAEFKSEYIDGEVREMAGAPIEHDRIVRSLLRSLDTSTESRGCETFTSDVRVQMAHRRFTYPDLTIVCGEPTFAPADIDTLANPTVVFEVLSHSTESYDLGDKARMYRQVDSLQGFVLVAQDRPWVEVWTRESSDSWRVREFTGLEASAELPALSIILTLREIYHRIDFTDS
ncbi:MAG: Uma2 family endonuclease [Armatimonas sp.]